MKKIITMLFCTAVFTSAFAQTNRHDADDRNKNVNTTWNSNSNQRGYDKDHDRDRSDKRYNNNSQRDIQVQRITQQYDYRIQQVSYNRQLNRRQKQRAIAQLQAEKEQALNRIYAQYNNRNVYNDRDNDRDRNNGYRK
jgi:hypothetical protein